MVCVPKSDTLHQEVVCETMDGFDMAPDLVVSRRNFWTKGDPLSDDVSQASVLFDGAVIDNTDTLMEPNEMGFVYRGLPELLSSNGI